MTLVSSIWLLLRQTKRLRPFVVDRQRSAFFGDFDPTKSLQPVAPVFIIALSPGGPSNPKAAILF